MAQPDTLRVDGARIAGAGGPVALRGLGLGGWTNKPGCRIREELAAILRRTAG